MREHGDTSHEENLGASSTVDDAAKEQSLVRRARGGDRAAFGDLVSRYMRRAYFAALGLVGSHDDALDLSQEAFARAYRARRTLDPERPFYPWLYQILRRLCFNFTRDRGRRRARLAEATPWLAESEGSRAARNDPARQAELAELRTRFESAIAQLPDGEREVLVLREFQDLRYKEIAELLDIPVGTVMSRLYSARKALARSLGGDS